MSNLDLQVEEKRKGDNSVLYQVAKAYGIDQIIFEAPTLPSLNREMRRKLEREKR